MLSKADLVLSKAGFSVGQFCLPGNIWQCLEIFLVKTITGVGELLLTSSEEWSGMLLNVF